LNLHFKSELDVKKLVLGATILGTGGGGDPEEGFKVLYKAIEITNRPVELINVEDIPSEGFVVVPYYVGSIAPGLKPRKTVKIIDPISRAFELLERELGGKIVSVVASEMGGFNTPVALSIGVLKGLPAVDGDLLGRAAPELHQCTVHIFGYSMTPSVLVSETGNIIVVKEYADIDDYESIARYLSILAGRFVAVVDTPLTREKADKAVVKNTISLAYKLGDEVLRAIESNESPAERIAKLLNGWIVFEGFVEKYTWRDEKGFLKGEAYIRGKGRYAGRLVKSYIMNEHIMVWIDNEPLVMPPDLFTLITPNGTPITNTALKEGMEVVAIAAPAPRVWRTPRGLELFGPRHFGFDYEYVPVEELVVKRGVI
jgi:DUF917 family protein